MTQAIQIQTEERVTEYAPFGSDDRIKLSVQIIRDFVAIKTKAGKLPDDRDCIRFIAMCKARRLNPYEGDAFLQGYDGKDGPVFSLITAHQAFLKRAEVNVEYNGMESGVIVKNGEGKIEDRIGDFTFDDDKLLGGWAVVYFKHRQFPIKRRLKLQTFNKGFGRWNDDAAGMIVKCAEADALRSSFPTMLGGLYTQEEGMPVIEVGPTKTPQFTGPAMQLPQTATPTPQPTVQPGVAASPTTPTAPATKRRKAEVGQVVAQPVQSPTPTPQPEPEPQPTAAVDEPPDDPFAAAEPPAAVFTAPEEETPATGPADDGPEAPNQPALEMEVVEPAELAEVRKFMALGGITEQQVLKFCAEKKLMGANGKPALKLSELAIPRLQQLRKNIANPKGPGVAAIKAV